MKRLIVYMAGILLLAGCSTPCLLYTSIAQQVHVTAHGQGIQRPSYRSVQIDKYLAVDKTFAGARRIQQRIVLRQQLQVRRRTFQIAEVHLAVNGKRILAGGINCLLYTSMERLREIPVLSCT